VLAGPNAEAISRARRDFARAAAGPRDWLADRARARGSWSTALLVEIGRGGRSLRASAIGDSCLFVLDGLELRAAFPLDSPAAFSNTPELVEDRARPGSGGTPRFRSVVVGLAGLRRPALILATDSLAAHLLASEDRRDLLRFLAQATLADFEAWARRGMAEGRLGRDDLTLLWIR
ncbi:MAG: hypothetical protein JNG85_10720, partial [Spirochaetaceae bacterium]|nr:hypothetical protein [Spirochaetaceae bacterium]